MNDSALPGADTSTSDLRCPACGAGTADADRFCEACGAALFGPPVQPDRSGHRVGPIAGLSDRGLRHHRNEDAMAFGSRTGEGSVRRVGAVVCDGVSTVHLPDLASRLAADVALKELLRAEPVPDCVRAAASVAAAAVTDLVPDDALDAPSCTMILAAADLLETGPARPRITIGWIGDTRAYWVPVEGSTDQPSVLTVDHSLATEMVRAGLLDKSAAQRDPRMHTITRWVGAGGSTEPEIVDFEPAGSGLLVLCTDGLWNYLPDPVDLAAVVAPALRAGGPSEAAEILTTFAIAAGGGDNITVVCLAIDCPTTDSQQGELR